MWYQYRCYRPVILLKRSLWRFFLAQVVAEVHDIHGRLHRIQQLLRLSTEKTDVETGGLTRWVHFLWYFNLVSYIIHENIYWPAKKKKWYFAGYSVERLAMENVVTSRSNDGMGINTSARLGIWRKSERIQQSWYDQPWCTYSKNGGIWGAMMVTQTRDVGHIWGGHH